MIRPDPDYRFDPRSPYHCDHCDANALGTYVTGCYIAPGDGVFVVRGTYHMHDLAVVPRDALTIRAAIRRYRSKAFRTWMKERGSA